MIQAKELRLGNIVIDNVTKRIGAVKQIDPRDNGIYTPIPLTEDWLIRMGFEKVEERYVIGYTQQQSLQCFTCIMIEVEETGLGYVIRLNDLIITACHSVHHLQNLYFALTGTELEI